MAMVCILRQKSVVQVRSQAHDYYCVTILQMMTDIADDDLHRLTTFLEEHNTTSARIDALRRLGGGSKKFSAAAATSVR